MIAGGSNGPEPGYDPPSRRGILNEAQGSTRLPDEAPLSPEEETLLGESVDLDADTRLKILRLYRSIDQADYYVLLGVERSADRKALKRAYFELASKLHPDRYFRKKLGSFKVRMEAVFSRITQAHDTLGNTQKRAQYDAYLDEQRRSRGIEELLEDALAEVRRAEARAEKEAADAEAAEAAASPAPSPSPSAPPVAPRTPSAPSQPPGPIVDVAIAARRDALARRLLGGRSRPSGAQQPVNPAGNGTTSSTSSRPSASDAMASLRRRYEERKNLAKETQARAYTTKGQQALASNDPVAAANAFRVALSLRPDDPELDRQAREAQAKADELLASTYENQAKYEEQNSQWAEAARSWGRVCRVRPKDARAHERGANAIVKAGADLHEAGRLAQRACTLDPESTAFRITLANVYLAAGLTLNARRELETAAQQSPQDGTIQAMLKRVGKSG